MGLERNHERTAAGVPAPGSFAGELRGDLRGLFCDLVLDAFAFRPLPPAARVPIPAVIAPSVPAAVRSALRWTLHAGVLLVFPLLVWFQVEAAIPLSQKLPGMILLPVALLATLCWPVVSGWLFLLALGISLSRPYGVAAPMTFADLSHSSMFTYTTAVRPWAWAGCLAFGALLVILGLRLRPRVAFGLWVLVTVIAVAGNGRFILGTSVTILLSGAMPLVSVVVTAWRDFRTEAEAQVEATEEERSRRMLLEERAVIARELHDVVAHHMSVVAIQAEAAPYRVVDPPPELEKAFVNVRESAVAALSELRRVLGVVRTVPQEAPVSGTSLSVTPDVVEAPQPTLDDLDTMLAGVRAVGALTEKVVTGEVRALPRGVELSAYRIVQEALSNALRHAPRTSVLVELAYGADGLTLRIVNGPPARPAPPSPGTGHGLTGMRERVAMLGGRLRTGPTEEGGFEVAGFLPSGRTEAEG